MATDAVHADGIDRRRSGARGRPPLAVATVLADSSVVVLALPDVLSSFDVSIERVSWVITAYNLVLALAAVPAAYLPCAAGAERVAAAGLACFALASAVCAVGRELRPPPRGPVRAGGERRGRGLCGARAPAGGCSARRVGASAAWAGGRRRSARRSGRPPAAPSPRRSRGAACSPPRCRWRSCRSLLLLARRVPAAGRVRRTACVHGSPRTWRSRLVSAALTAALFLLVLELVRDGAWTRSRRPRCSR